MTFVDFERGAAGYMIGGITGSAGTIELATVVFDSSEYGRFRTKTWLCRSFFSIGDSDLNSCSGSARCAERPGDSVRAVPSYQLSLAEVSVTRDYRDRHPLRPFVC